MIRKDDSFISFYSTLDSRLSFRLGSFSVLPRRILFSPDSALAVVQVRCVTVVGVTIRDDTIRVYDVLTQHYETWSVPSDASIADFAFSSDAQSLFLCCRFAAQVVLYTLGLSHQLNCLCAWRWRGVRRRRQYDGRCVRAGGEERGMSNCGRRAWRAAGVWLLRAELRERVSSEWWSDSVDVRMRRGGDV